MNCVNPMKKATFLSFILAACLTPIGCATFFSGLQTSTAYLRTAGNILGTEVLQRAVSDSDRVTKANLVYAAAHAVRTLVNPTPDQLKAVLTQWLPNKEWWGVLADGVAAAWIHFEDTWSGNPKTATNALEQLALGFEDAANAITHPTP